MSVNDSNEIFCEDMENNNDLQDNIDGFVQDDTSDLIKDEKSNADNNDEQLSTDKNDSSLNNKIDEDDDSRFDCFENVVWLN